MLQSLAGPSLLHRAGGDHRRLQSALPGLLCRQPRPAGIATWPSILADVEAFLSARGPLDVLQLSGGEPLLHPQLLEIIDECRKLPIQYIMINTNGRQLARDAALAAELARRKPRLELNLQLDGLDAASHVALRGADLLAEKQAALARVVEYELPTTLVCTVVQGVNEHESGAAVEARAANAHRPRHHLSAGHVGRPLPAGNQPLERTTLADVVRLLVQQSGGLLAAEDFNPLPCSDPNCCSFTYVARRRPMIPLTRIVKYEDHLDKLADRIAFDMGHANQCCGGKRRLEVGRFLPHRHQALHGCLYLRPGSHRRMLHTRRAVPGAGPCRSASSTPWSGQGRVKQL